MRIQKVDRNDVIFVETDNEIYDMFIRFNPNDWYVMFGMSYEPMAPTESLEMEALYQEFIMEKI